MSLGCGVRGDRAPQIVMEHSKDPVLSSITDLGMADGVVVL